MVIFTVIYVTTTTTVWALSHACLCCKVQAPGAKGSIKLHLHCLLPGEETVAPPSALLVQSRYSYHLFTITSSINGCVCGRRCNNQSESLLSLPLRSGATMAQMPANLQGANKEKRFSSHETDLPAQSVKAWERTVRWQVAFKAVKKKKNGLK